MFDVKLKNVANTNVIHWGGRLMALWEGGDTHSLTYLLTHLLTH
jgi:all-trans-8'-apo-beta-carotenal 15,15'-oxygenase